MTYEIFEKIFTVMGQYCHLLYSPHYIIMCIFEIKVDDISSALRFLEMLQLKRMLRHSEKQEKFEMI